MDSETKNQLVVALLLMIAAMADTACGKSASTANSNETFPSDLQYQQPAALK
jgi:hypothetical protein